MALHSMDSVLFFLLLVIPLWAEEIAVDHVDLDVIFLNTEMTKFDTLVTNRNELIFLPIMHGFWIR